MHIGEEKVTCVRDDEKKEVAISQLMLGDIFERDGLQMQLVTVRTTFGAAGAPFIFNGRWYEKEQVRDSAMPIVLRPNAPFGERDYHEMPVPFLPSTIVDMLDLKVLGRTS